MNKNALILVLLFLFVFPFRAYPICKVVSMRQGAAAASHSSVICVIEVDGQQHEQTLAKENCDKACDEYLSKRPGGSPALEIEKVLEKMEHGQAAIKQSPASMSCAPILKNVQEGETSLLQDNERHIVPNLDTCTAIIVTLQNGNKIISHIAKETPIPCKIPGDENSCDKRNECRKNNSCYRLNVEAALKASREFLKIKGMSVEDGKINVYWTMEDGIGPVKTAFSQPKVSGFLFQIVSESGVIDQQVTSGTYLLVEKNAVKKCINPKDNKHHCDDPANYRE